MHGAPLVHAQGHVALEVNLKQEHIVVINPALVATHIPKIVKVSKYLKY